jgi:uncharacterized protein (DUF924 family)
MGKDVTAQVVLDFWFGASDAPEYGATRKEWFVKDREFDAQVRERFFEHHKRALAGELDDWQGTPEGLLALIVTLDQFPRNMFRNQAEAFASDALALHYARRMVERGWDEELLPVMRSFVYLPFEHGESLALQKASVALFERLVLADPKLDDMLAYARRHFDVITRFGRFPHRNQALGRDSSADEIAFLSKPGSSF